MAIPSRQIGWGTEENLLWQISKQLEGLTGVLSRVGSTTTISTNILSFPISYTSLRLRCDGISVNSIYTSETVNNIDELVILCNTNVEIKTLGNYSASITSQLVLTLPSTVKNLYCPNGTLTLEVFPD